MAYEHAEPTADLNIDCGSACNQMDVLYRSWQTVVALMLTVPIVGWVMHQASGNAQTHLVMISEIGIDAPEAYLFIIGYTIIAIISIPLLFHIFTQNLADMPEITDTKLQLANLSGLVTGLAWAVGLLIVANYDTVNESEVHDLGAALTFFALPITGVILARLDKDICSRGLRVHSRVSPFTFRLLGAVIVMLVLFFLTHDLAHRMHPDVEGYREMGAERGWFYLYTAIEWVLALLLIGVIWCFEPYFATTGDYDDE